MQRYKIGEVSKIVDMPAETIRFLEQKGLISPEKNEETGYRFYSVWDINRILDYKKFRQIGFSSGETIKLVKDSGFSELLEQLDVKKKESVYLAHYYQAKALKLKNFQAVLNNVPNLIGKYYILNRAENYSLFTRSHSGSGLKMTDARDTQGGFEEITGHYPFVEHIYRLKKKELELPANLEEAEWGFTVKKYWVNRMGIQLLPGMEHLSPTTCLFTIISLEEKEYFTRAALTNVFSYMEEHHYTLCGDILGIFIASVLDGNRNVRYLELWVPIREDGKELPHYDEYKRDELRRIFG